MDFDRLPVPPADIPTLTEEAPPLVPMGRPMPDSARLPTLLPATQAIAPAAMVGPNRASTLGQGLSFVGAATLDGSLIVAGQFEGHVHAAGEGSDGHVTVAPTGRVHGDIRARNISVQGVTDGVLDAAGGRVSLHDTAQVSGRIRYTHLQVNGADLNAQLERVRPEGDGPSTR